MAASSSSAATKETLEQLFHRCREGGQAPKATQLVRLFQESVAQEPLRDQLGYFISIVRLCKMRSSVLKVWQPGSALERAVKGALQKNPSTFPEFVFAVVKGLKEPRLLFTSDPWFKDIKLEARLLIRLIPKESPTSDREKLRLRFVHWHLEDPRLREEIESRLPGEFDTPERVSRLLELKRSQEAAKLLLKLLHKNGILPPYDLIRAIARAGGWRGDDLLALLRHLPEFRCDELKKAVAALPDHFANKKEWPEAVRIAKSWGPLNLRKSKEALEHSPTIWYDAMQKAPEIETFQITYFDALKLLNVLESHEEPAGKDIEILRVILEDVRPFAEVLPKLFALIGKWKSADLFATLDKQLCDLVPVVARQRRFTPLLLGQLMSLHSRTCKALSEPGLDAQWKGLIATHPALSKLSTHRACRNVIVEEALQESPSLETLHTLIVDGHFIQERRCMELFPKLWEEMAQAHPPDLIYELSYSIAVLFQSRRRYSAEWSAPLRSICSTILERDDLRGARPIILQDIVRHLPDHLRNPLAAQLLGAMRLKATEQPELWPALLEWHCEARGAIGERAESIGQVLFFSLLPRAISGADPVLLHHMLYHLSLGTWLTKAEHLTMFHRRLRASVQRAPDLVRLQILGYLLDAEGGKSTDELAAANFRGFTRKTKEYSDLEWGEDPTNTCFIWAVAVSCRAIRVCTRAKEESDRARDMGRASEALKDAASAKWYYTQMSKQNKIIGECYNQIGSLQELFEPADNAVFVHYSNALANIVIHLPGIAFDPEEGIKQCEKRWEQLIDAPGETHSPALLPLTGLLLDWFSIKGEEDRIEHLLNKINEKRPYRHYPPLFPAHLARATLRTTIGSSGRALRVKGVDSAIKMLRQARPLLLGEELGSILTAWIQETQKIHPGIAALGSFQSLLEGDLFESLPPWRQHQLQQLLRRSAPRRSGSAAASSSSACN